jgi:hypothetical protein
MNLEPLPTTFPATVAALHRVAEETVSPARKPDNEIALEATAGGFGTPVFDEDGARKQVRVEGAELVWVADGDERRERLDGVDPEAAARLADWFAFGDAILRALVAAAGPGDEPTPIRLWPEHFDIAVEMGAERANYGFSPGDEQHPEPYAYVGPWTAEVDGALWNATAFRGAELSYAELLAAPDQRAAAIEFFTTRKEALA